jgi:hypothetical protein
MHRLLAGIAVLALAGPAVAQEQPAQSAQRQVRRVSAPPVQVEGNCATVPMRLLNNIPVVEVTIGGQGPFLFAIDTGAAGHGRISQALAERLGLAVIGEARTPAPGGTTENRPIYGAGPIALGGVTFSGAGLLVLSAARGPNPGWDGILGIDMFRELTLTIDYGNSVAGVSRAPLTQGVAASFNAGIPNIPVEIAGRTFRVDLDTGNGAGGLFLREADARALPLSGAPVERGRARTSFGEFAIMEAPLGAPVTVGGNALNHHMVGWPPARGDGNLGSRALAGSILRVDRRSGRVSIAASAARPACSA